MTAPAVARRRAEAAGEDERAARDSKPCQGDCCVSFVVPHTIDELRSGDVGDSDPAEALALADMLVPISVGEANERQARLVVGEPQEYGEGDEGRLYRCRHWDEGTRLCGVYEDRPPMCSRFPYGKPCRYGCSCAGEEPAAGVIV